MSLRKTWGVALFLFLLCGMQMAFARDVFVMLSGGASPMDNNFSQYLQARAVSGWFRRHYPADSVWTFFGAGNTEGRPPVFADVHREILEDGLEVDSWLPGVLAQNHPARRSDFLRCLEREILPAVHDGGTLFLFVGDHGFRQRGREGESMINLWGMAPDPNSEHGWRSDDSEVLGVSELRRVLARGLGKGKVVFCMTQCHSGGFHFLGIQRDPVPESSWFVSRPRWAMAGRASLQVAAAGFSATDEYSVASGCNPDPDPDNWAGYERFFPEAWLGMDLTTGDADGSGRGLPSFAEAHSVAARVDYAIDLPRSTSEQYMDQWSRVIDRCARAPQSLTPAARAALKVYESVRDGVLPAGVDPAVRHQWSLYLQTLEGLTGQDMKLRRLPLAPRAELDRVIKQEEDSGDDSSAPGKGGERQAKRAWRQQILPAWKQAIAIGQPAVLPAGAKKFEKHLLERDGQGADFMFGDYDQLQEEIYWDSGYSNPLTMDPVRARAIALWGAERRDKIIEWAKSSDASEVQAAGEVLAKYFAPTSDQGGGDSSPVVIDRLTLARRTLFYRHVIGAWQFLLSLHDQPALNELREIRELEATPLPPRR